MSDPLNVNEHTPDLIQNRDGDVQYEAERNRLRALPPMNQTHLSNDFLNRTKMYDNGDDIREPIQGGDQIFVRGAVEENTISNQRTLHHDLRREQQQLKQRMNQAIHARQAEYDKLSISSYPSQKTGGDGVGSVGGSSSSGGGVGSGGVGGGVGGVGGVGSGSGGSGSGGIGSFKKVVSHPQTQGITLAPLAVNEDPQPRKDKSIVEGFTSPGKVLGQHEDLLYKNETIETRVLKHDHNREFKQNYRRHFEEQRAREQKLDRMNVARDDPIRSHNYNYTLPPTSSSEGDKSVISRPGGFGILPKDTVGNQLTNPHEGDRYNKPAQTVVTIDSRDRDKTRYPNSNQFKIFLGKQFRQVKRVVIQSTEFPNTDVLIRDDPQAALYERNRILLDCGEVLNDANNHLYWINDEDAISKGIYECLFYTADLTPGNYTGIACECNERTLAEEIEDKVSQINHFDDGTPHQFIVDIDTQTNIVRFLSVESSSLGLDPVSTTAGLNLVTIQQTAHPFVVGDTVTITNSTSVGGITEDIINAEHTIQSVTADTFTFQVSQIATGTSSGGGANVLSGQNKPMKLLFSNIDTFGSILGFPQQDSSDQIANNIEFIDIRPFDLSSLPLVRSSPGTLPARLQSPLESVLSNHF